jgi:hypothetical protein
MPTTSKCTMVEDSDEDEEPGHVGETLDANGDSVMDPVGDKGETVSVGTPCLWTMLTVAIAICSSVQPRCVNIS